MNFWQATALRLGHGQTAAQRFRSAAIPLGVVASLAWVAPAAAISTLTWVPFQTSFTCIGSTQGQGTSCLGSSGPLGGSTAIEYVSFSCTVRAQDGGLGAVWIETDVAGKTVVHYLNVPLGHSPSRSIGSFVVSGGQAASFYSERGSVIQMFGFSTSNEGSAMTCNFAVSGQQGVS